MLIKRTLDILLAVIGLVVLIVPFFIIALAVKISSRGPAVFWTKRIGRYNKLFMMPKFRSMYIDAPQLATHLFNDSRSYITPLGHILRKSSLDEIPQLFSILKGDMSFVGPRPALFNQRDLKNMRSKTGVDVLLPGLTGWAQVNGRDDITLEQKVKFDQEYLDRRSLIFDIYILYMTFVKVFLRKDISH